MMKKRTQLIVGFATVLTLVCISILSFGQNEDANPYGGIYYNDHVNQRFYGRFVAPRSDAANLDTLTNLIKGSFVFDTLENRLEYVDTNGTWVGVSGGNTLDQAYDQGGSGAGREIDAVDGAVWVSGEDGFIVTGSFGSGDTSQWVGAGTGMFFEPNKAAFRAGFVTGSQWNDNNVGLGSIAIGSSTESSGLYSSSFGSATTASGVSSLATGNSTTAESYAETAIGLYNTDYTPTSTSAWEATDRLFVIGNGQSGVTRSNALTILKNGNSGLGTDTPTETLEVDGTTLISNDTAKVLVGQETNLIGGMFPLTLSGTLVSYKQGSNLDTLFQIFDGHRFAGDIGIDEHVIRLGSKHLSSGWFGASLEIGKQIISIRSSESPVGGIEPNIVSMDTTGLLVSLLYDDSNFKVLFGDDDYQALSVKVDSTTISNTLKYVDGNEANGYILTSDASGNASWESPNTVLSSGVSYIDATYTSGSPYTVSATTDTEIPFVWETENNNTLPTGVDSLFSRLDTTIIGDNTRWFSVTFYMKSVPSNAAQWVDVWVDIGGSIGELYRQTFAFPKGSGVERNILYSVSAMYSGTTFEANGGKLMIRSSHSLDIYDMNLNFKL